MERDQAMKFMHDLLRLMVQKKGSDLFITASFPPAIKIDGEIRPQTDKPLSAEQSAILVRAIMNDRQTREFDATKEANFAIAPPGIGRLMKWMTCVRIVGAPSVAAGCRVLRAARPDHFASR